MTACYALQFAFEALFQWHPSQFESVCKFFFNLLVTGIKLMFKWVAGLNSNYIALKCSGLKCKLYLPHFFEV